MRSVTSLNAPMNSGAAAINSLRASRRRAISPRSKPAEQPDDEQDEEQGREVQKQAQSECHRPLDGGASRAALPRLQTDKQRREDQRECDDEDSDRVP